MENNIDILRKLAGEVNEPIPEEHPSAPVQKLRPRAEVILYTETGVWGIIYEDEGYIQFPGGGIAPGERPVEAAIRETLEESDRICHNIEEKGQQSAIYGEDGFHFKDWDGETTYFFLALDGGAAQMGHPDQEDFYVIPFDQAIAFLSSVLDVKEQLWAYNNNTTRIGIIQEAQQKAASDLGLQPVKYASMVMHKLSAFNKQAGVISGVRKGLSRYWNVLTGKNYKNTQYMMQRFNDTIAKQKASNIEALKNTTNSLPDKIKNRVQAIYASSISPKQKQLQVHNYLKNESATKKQYSKLYDKIMENLRMGKMTEQEIAAMERANTGRVRVITGAGVIGLGSAGALAIFNDKR